MKRVLIITSYSGNNFGSSLQAFALQRYLKNKEFVPCFLSIKDNKVNRLKRFFVRLFKGLTDFHLLKKEIKIKFSKKSNYSLENASDVFIQEHLEVLELKRKSAFELAHSTDVAYCIVGSDQIWNPEDPYLDSSIFLKFSPREKNFSYAASFGQNYIFKYNIKQFKNGLKNFSHISCREESGCALCNKLGFDCCETLDPTLLFDKNEWLSFFGIQQVKTRKTLLLYFIGPVSNEIKNKLSHFSANFDDAILLTKYNQHINGIRTINATTIDFLRYFSSASFVITDSFHGTIFSINFNIPFYTVSRVYINADGDNNERVLNILKKLNLNTRLVDYTTLNILEDLKPIDYERINEKLAILKQNSEKYLDDCLND